MSSAAALLQILSVPTLSAQGTAAPAPDTDAAAFTDLVTQLMAPAAADEAEPAAEPAPSGTPALTAPAALPLAVLVPNLQIAGAAEAPHAPVEDAEPVKAKPAEAKPVEPEPADVEPVKDEAPTNDAQLPVLAQTVLPLPVAAPQAKAVPVQTEAKPQIQTAPAETPLPVLAARPAPKTGDAPVEDAPKADLDSIKTELSALKLDTPEAVKPLPVEAPRQAPSPAFSIQPVAAEVTATPYTPTAQIAAQASAVSHAAVEQLTQLSVAIQKRLGEGTTKFQLELKPADMGRIDVALTITAEGKVNAHLEFDTPITATTFAARESELRQQLTAAGLKIDGDALTFSSRPTETAQTQNTPTAPAHTQNSFTAFTDQQTGQQPRSNARQAARALKHADQNAIEADLDAALNSALAHLRQRPGSGRLALDLTV